MHSFTSAYLVVRAPRARRVRNEVILSLRSVGALLLGAANAAIGKRKGLGERDGLRRVSIPEVAVAVGGFPLVERPSIE